MDNPWSGHGLPLAQDFLFSLVESAPHGVFVKDSESRFIAANQIIADMMGARDPRALIGKRDDEFYPREAAAGYLAEERQIIATGQPLIDRAISRRVRGELRWMLVSKYPVRDREGRLVGIVGFTQDLTERKREHEATEIEHKLLRAVVDIVPHAIYAKDRGYRKTMANPVDVAIMGAASEEEVIGKTDDQFFAPEVAAAFRRDDEAVVRGGASVIDREECYFDGGGKKRWLLTSKIPLRDAEGEVVGLVGIGNDITERKIDEEKIREQAQLLDIAFDAIMVLDMDNRIRYWNKSAEQHCGYTAAESIGRDPRELLRCGTTEELAEAIRVTHEQGVWIGDLHFASARGEQGVMQSRWTLVRDPDGTQRSILCVSTDVTDERSIQAQLFRAQRLESLGTLAGGIAHDLNNVLTPILMGLDSIRAESSPEGRDRLIDLLKASAQRGAGIIRQVLGFVRGVEGEKARVHLDQILLDVAQILRETFPKSVAVRMSAPSELWPVTANATQIHQVMMNLCVNARDAMPDGGILTLSGENVVLDETYARLHIDAKPIRYIVLKVEDTGTGIPPLLLDKIFDPFFTTKERGKGTGLGLSTALTIVKGYGGFMNVYSDPGRGSSFRVYLPAAEIDSTASAGEEPVDAPAGAGELVLVVDDEEPVRDIVQQILESHGYRVICAEDGAAGLAAYMENRAEIRVVIVDMVMPFMDGAATVRALERLDPAVRIIASSGLVASGRAAEAQNLDVTAFLAKPYTTETLLRTVRRALE